VKKLILFHHDPDHDDQRMDELVTHARALVTQANASLKVEAASEGLVIQLGGK